MIISGITTSVCWMVNCTQNWWYNFWVRVEVYDKEAAEEELRWERATDPDGANMTRKELWLKNFSEAKIRSTIVWADLVITRSLTTQLLKVNDFGKYYRDTNERTILFLNFLPHWKKKISEGNLEEKREISLIPSMKIPTKEQYYFTFSIANFPL